MIPAFEPAATTDARATKLRALWPTRRPVIMGILNCTPDSFSDGGRHPTAEAAVEHALRMVREGATIIDVGGESTRPGAEPVSADEERRRVLPVIAEIRRIAPETIISVDTTKAPVAASALDAGADLVNDVSAAGDPAMAETVADRRAGLILMHMRGRPQTMQADTAYDDVVAEVREYLGGRAAEVIRAGVDPDLVWLDPGLGFGKDDRGNLQILAHLEAIEDLGHPIVVGASRKSTVGRLTGAPVGGRLPGSLAAIVPAARLERAVVRVHDPAPTLQFLTVLAAIEEAGS